MAQAEIRTNMDTIVVNVNESLPYDPKDFSAAKFKYIGRNPTEDEDDESRTTTLGYTFVGETPVEVKNPVHKYKLRGNPHFEEVGGKKGESRVSEDNTVDPEEQGAGVDDMEKDARRGQNYETMRDAPSVLDLPNPLSREQQKLTDEKDIDAGRKTIADSSDPKAKAKRPAEK